VKSVKCKVKSLIFNFSLLTFNFIAPYYNQNQLLLLTYATRILIDKLFFTSVSFFSTVFTSRVYSSFNTCCIKRTPNDVVFNPW